MKSVSSNIVVPQPLKKGDTIALISPAKSISEELILQAKERFETNGYKVLIGEHAAGRFNYFSGTEEERRADLQWAIDHPEVIAIVCNRGGYGAIHLLETANYANLLREPRWLFGFSDITNFHCLGLNIGMASVHSTMPLNFNENTPDSLETIFSILETGTVGFSWEPNSFNKTGETQGMVVGGNLAILYSLLGTKYFPPVDGSILFIEDIGEQAYQLDRMLYAFQLAGVWDRISGLIVGGMTDISETAVPTLLDYKQTLLKILQYRSIPIAFDAPIGHQNDNRAVIVGKVGQFKVSDSLVSFQQR